MKALGMIINTNSYYLIKNGVKTNNSRFPNLSNYKGRNKIFSVDQSI